MQEVFISLFVLLLPTQLGKHFFFDFSLVNGIRIDYLAPTLYLTDLIFLCVLLTYHAVIIKLIKEHANQLLILGVFFSINIFLSPYPIVALYHLIKIIELVLITVIFSKSKVTLNKLIPFFLFGAGIELALGLFQLHQGGSLQGVVYFLGERYLNMNHAGVAKAALNGVVFLRPYGTFSHPNSLAGFYLLLYSFFLLNRPKENAPKRILYKVIERHSGGNGVTDRILNGILSLRSRMTSQSLYLIYIALLVTTSTLVFISFSKTAIIAYCLVTFLYMTKSIKPDCFLCFAARTLSLAAIALVVLLTQTDPLSLEKRLALFSHAVLILKTHAIFGTGLGHYLFYEAKQQFNYPYFSLQPVHNIFILFLAEAGALLTIVAIYITRSIIKQLIKYKAAGAVILVIIVTGSFDHYWLTLQQNWLLLGVVGGLIWKEIGLPKTTT